MTTLRRTLLAAPLLCAVGPLFAHDDDPKLLDREPPVFGPGYRRSAAAPRAGGGPATAGGGGFSAHGVTLLSWLPLNQLDGAQSGNDVWGYVSPSGREYAIVGTYSSTCFVEVTQPTQPTLVAVMDGPDSLWRDMRTYDQYAYSVSEGGGGIQVFDLTAIDAGTVTEIDDAFDTGATHNVAVDVESGFLYRTGGGQHGLRIYDLANPAQPAFVGLWSARYVHDAQPVTYTQGPFAGRQIVFACGGFNNGFSNTRLEVLDVTDKQNIVALSSASYPERAYAHQGWLSPGRDWFYLGDELDEDGSLPTTTHIIDVSDIEDVFTVGSFTNGNNSIGHNLITRRNLIFEANYTSGLRVFDAADPTEPVEIGYLDTRPENDNDSFNGLWGVYPSLPSGIILGSDLERGLFVMWADEPELAVHLPQGAPDLVAPGGSSLIVEIVEATAGVLDPSTPRLVHDAGGSFSAVPLVHLGGNRYRADFPTMDCADVLQWYVAAETQAGVPWTQPADAPLEVFASMASASATTAARYPMSSPFVWSSGDPADDAVAGAWEQGTPIGTVAQPGGDHSGGSGAWFTGQGSSGAPAELSDVDQGRTTLTSPPIDLSLLVDPRLSYWRWFSNDAGSAPGEDVLLVELSDDDGASWVLAETVGPTGPGTSGGWRQHSLRVGDFIAPTSTVRMRIVASDLGADSLVEAAIDDVRFFESLCADCNANAVDDAFDITSGASTDANFNGIPDECECRVEAYCQAAPNSQTAGAHLAASGSTNIGAGDLTLEVADARSEVFGFFFYGAGQIQVPFGDGFRCVGSGGVGTFRILPPERTDIFGSYARTLDFGSPPLDAGAGRIDPDSTWNFQFWYRDPNGPQGSGFNLSDALSIGFCP